MLKSRVVRWTKGQVWVVVAFTVVVWFGLFSLYMDMMQHPLDTPPWFNIPLTLVVLVIPFVVARVLFVWYGPRETPTRRD